VTCCTFSSQCDYTLDPWNGCTHTPNETLLVTLVISLVEKVGGGTMCYVWN